MCSWWDSSVTGAKEWETCGVLKACSSPQLKLEAGKYLSNSCQHLPWMAREYCANTTIFLFGRSVHRDSVTVNRVKPALWTVTSPVCAAVLLQLEDLTPSFLCTSSSCITVPAESLPTQFLAGPRASKPSFKTRHSLSFPNL